MKIRLLLFLVFLSSTLTACDIICPPEPEKGATKDQKDSTFVEVTPIRLPSFR